mmetsp:Transcript_21136/g.34969  ORF Transcript_21136/g.34969 Transcript_21136/m.34969 type:complete len:657 (-) Transcript_21136:367-2337(-)
MALISQLSPVGPRTLCLVVALLLARCVEIDAVDCSGYQQLVASVAAGVVLQSNDVGIYNKRINCQWAVTAPSGFNVSLNFSTFVLESVKANVYVVTATGKVYNLTGTIAAPFSINCGSSAIVMFMSSSPNIGLAGFKADAFAVAPSAPVTLSPPSTDAISLTATSLGAAIETNAAGSTYSNNDYHAWLITDSSNIRLTFTAFVTENTFDLFLVFNETRNLNIYSGIVACPFSLDLGKDAVVFFYADRSSTKSGVFAKAFGGPTCSPTPSPSNTPSSLPTPSVTDTPTYSLTPSPSDTPSYSPTATRTNTPTSSHTRTPTSSPTPSSSPTPTASPSPTSTHSSSPTHSSTPTSSRTPSPTYVPEIIGLSALSIQYDRSQSLSIALNLNVIDTFGFATYECLLKSASNQDHGQSTTIGDGRLLSCPYTASFASPDTTFSISISFDNGVLVLRSPYDIYTYAATIEGTAPASGTATVILSTAQSASLVEVSSNIEFMSALVDLLELQTGAHFVIDMSSSQNTTAPSSAKRHLSAAAVGCSGLSGVSLNFKVVVNSSGPSISDIVTTLNSDTMKQLLAAALSFNGDPLACLDSSGEATGTTTTNSQQPTSSSSDMLGLGLGLGIGLGVFALVTASVGTFLYVKGAKKLKANGPPNPGNNV